jgi:ankyrin repeat protein
MKNINLSDSELLFKAIRNSDLEKVKSLLEQNSANSNFVNQTILMGRSHVTPLYAAARDIDMVTLLLEHGANPNLKNGSLENYDNPEEEEDFAEYPVWSAILEGTYELRAYHLPVIELLLQKSNAINPIPYFHKVMYENRDNTEIFLKLLDLLITYNQNNNGIISSKLLNYVFMGGSSDLLDYLLFNEGYKFAVQDQAKVLLEAVNLIKADYVEEGFYVEDLFVKIVRMCSIAPEILEVVDQDGNTILHRLIQNDAPESKIMRVLELHRDNNYFADIDNIKPIVGLSLNSPHKQFILNFIVASTLGG